MYANEFVTAADEDGSANRSLTSLTFDQIRLDILLGNLKPEERLRINSLADRYKVGPTAVREALSRLVTSGFVESEDQRGFSVAPVSRAELLDLTQTRIDLESLALCKAIENGNVDWESNVISAFHRLSKFHAAPMDQEAMDGWSKAHRQFHASLLNGCNSTWMMRIAGLLYERSERYRNLSILQAEPKEHNLLAEERARDVLNEHRALMDAAINRNADQAKELLAKHFWATTNIILNAENGLLKSKARPKRSAA